MIEKLKIWFECKRLRKWRKYINHENKIQAELQQVQKKQMELENLKW